MCICLVHGHSAQCSVHLAFVYYSIMCAMFVLFCVARVCACIFYVSAHSCIVRRHVALCSLVLCRVAELCSGMPVCTTYCIKRVGLGRDD
jgi:hypothetical protein